MTSVSEEFLDRKICVLLYLEFINPAVTYTRHILREIHDLNIEAINEVEQNPLLHKRILREFTTRAQMLSVVDRMDMW